MTRKIWILIPAGLMLLMVIALTSQPSQAASSHSAVSPQATITSTPTSRWVVANENAASDWLTFASADDINAVVIDGDDLWAASTGGLLRWNHKDGTLTQYLAPQVPLPGNLLEGLLLANGKLYISSENGVAIFDRQDHWQTYTKQEIGLNEGWFGPLALIDDVLWVGSHHGLAKLYPDGHWEVVTSGSKTFPWSSVDWIEKGADGVYVTVTDSGPVSERQSAVVRFANDQWQIVKTPAPDHFIAPDGSWWQSEQKRVVKSTDQGKTWHVVYEGGIWPRLLAFDQDKTYLTGDKGIVVVKDDRVIETYNFADVGPELNFVNIIKHDEAGRMWIGTDGRGLSMFDGQRWHNWQPENSGLREDGIRGMALANDKVYLGLFGCAGCGGVAIYDAMQDRWTIFWPGESELSGGGVGGIAIDPQGRVYLPTSAGILDIYDAGNWKHIPMTPMFDNVILSPEAGAFDREGHYWMGTSGLGLGLWEYDGNEWQTYLSGYDVHALAFDKDGRLWATTSSGLVVRDVDGLWHVYTSDKYPLTDNWLQDVEIDAEGRVWTVTTDGLHIFNGKDWQVIKPETVGASLWEGAIDFDTQNRAWIGTSFSGVAIFKGKPQIGPFVGLVDPPPFQEEQPRVVESRSPWSFLMQGLCLVVFAPGAFAIERVYHKSRRRRMQS